MSHSLPARMKRAALRWKRSLKIKLGITPDQQDAPQVIAADAMQYWTSSETETEQRDQSHWLGTGRWDQQTWEAVGNDHFALYQTLVHLTKRQAPVKTMAEWGPGGGANASRFAKDIPKFYGIDISAPNLKECARQLDLRQYKGFRPVLIDASTPDQVLAGVTEPLDFFLCTAVYQHFPGKDYGIRVTELAYQMLAPGGIALIQTRYDDGSHKYAPKVGNYKENVITFTSYTIEEFWEIARRAGFNTHAVILKPVSNYAFYLLSKT